MKIKAIFSFLLFSDSWVSLCFFTLSFGVGDFFNVENNLPKSVFSFFAILLAYQLHRSKRTKHIADIKSERLAWLVTNKIVRNVLVIISTIGLVFTLFFVKVTLINLCVLATNGVLVLLYTHPTKQCNGLRNIPYLKSLFIGISWSIFILLNVSILEKEVFQVAFLVFFSVQLQLIPFDLRDVAYDSPKMKTLPQVFGKNIQWIYFLGTILFVLTTSLFFECNFLLLLSALISFIGFFLPKKYPLLSEFLWETPLMILGFYFLFR